MLFTTARDPVNDRRREAEWGVRGTSSTCPESLLVSDDAKSPTLTEVWNPSFEGISAILRKRTHNVYEAKLNHRPTYSG
jgi:hypothetical protein